MKNKRSINILDICFGLGYNTLATLYYIQEQNLDIKVHIYSPELDGGLVKSLKDFEYPEDFQSFRKFIDEVSQKGIYKDKTCSIEVYTGDAREYLKELLKRNIEFDIVYQDPFSSEVNSTLWTVEYFNDIYKLLKDEAIVTTYSIATPVRLSMYESGLNIYEIQGTNKRKSTIGLKNKSDLYKYIDMELKKQRNKEAKALRD